MTDPVKLFISSSCGHCQDIKKVIESGKFTVDGQEGAKVDLINVDTEEGFLNIAIYDLTVVPSAYSDKTKCRLLINPGNQFLNIKCHE